MPLLDSRDLLQAKKRDRSTVRLKWKKKCINKCYTIKNQRLKSTELLMFSHFVCLYSLPSISEFEKENSLKNKDVQLCRYKTKLKIG